MSREVLLAAVDGRNDADDKAIILAASMPFISGAAG